MPAARAIFVILALAAAAPSALAQSAFVQGGYGVEMRRFSAEEGDRIFDANSGHLTIGGGGFLTPHISASLELERGEASTVTRSATLTFASGPGTVTTAYTLRRRGASALIGIHSSAARRIRVGAYAGLSFSSVRREIASNAPPIVLALPLDTAVFTDRTAGPIVGVDAAFHVAPHVAVVGMLRAQALTLTGDLRGFTVRPSAGARITF
jgi:hypothetical protein